MVKLRATVLKIGINRCVNVPQNLVRNLLQQAGRTRGPIPVRGRLNGAQFVQTVVKYRGAWRLYLNTQMRRYAGVDVGDIAHVQMEFDPSPRPEPMNTILANVLSRNKKAHRAFNLLIPSRQKEILRYLNSLKSEEAVRRNVGKVVTALLKTER